MTANNSKQSNPYASAPPVYDRFVDESGMLTSVWQRWFSETYASMGEFIQHDYVVQPNLATRENLLDTAILVAGHITINDRDNLQNALEGSIIYVVDEVPPVIQIRQNGAWVNLP